MVRLTENQARLVLELVREMERYLPQDHPMLRERANIEDDVAPRAVSVETIKLNVESQLQNPTKPKELIDVILEYLFTLNRTFFEKRTIKWMMNVLLRPSEQPKLAAELSREPCCRQCGRTFSTNQLATVRNQAIYCFNCFRPEVSVCAQGHIQTVPDSVLRALRNKAKSCKQCEKNAKDANGQPAPDPRQPGEVFIDEDMPPNMNELRHGWAEMNANQVANGGRAIAWGGQQARGPR